MTTEAQKTPSQSENRLRNSGRTHFRKGKSPNPGGRPKGLAALVRSKTKDGFELVELMLSMMRGELVLNRYTNEGIPYNQPPSHKDRMDAAEWLADRGFGKSPLSVELKTDAPVDPEALAIAQALRRPKT